MPAENPPAISSKSIIDIEVEFMTDGQMPTYKLALDEVIAKKPTIFTLPALPNPATNSEWHIG